MLKQTTFIMYSYWILCSTILCIAKSLSLHFQSSFLNNYQNAGKTYNDFEPAEECSLTTGFPSFSGMLWLVKD